MTRKSTVLPWILFAMAAVQAVSGVLVTGGCACQPDFRRIGFMVAFGIAALVVVLVGLGYLSRQRPRAAALVAVMLEAGLLTMMSHPSVLPPLVAWYPQFPAMLLATAAVTVAFLWR